MNESCRTHMSEPCAEVDCQVDYSDRWYFFVSAQMCVRTEMPALCHRTPSWNWLFFNLHRDIVNVLYSEAADETIGRCLVEDIRKLLSAGMSYDCETLHMCPDVLKQSAASRQDIHPLNRLQYMKRSPVMYIHASIWPGCSISYMGWPWFVMVDLKGS